MGYYDDSPPSSFFEPNIIQANEDVREWRVEYTKRAIDLAEAIHSRAVCLATGRPLPRHCLRRLRSTCMSRCERFWTTPIHEE